DDHRRSRRGSAADSLRVRAPRIDSAGDVRPSLHGHADEARRTVGNHWPLSPPIADGFGLPAGADGSADGLRLPVLATGRRLADEASGLANGGGQLSSE